MRKGGRTAVATALLLLGSACSTVKSENLRTGGIEPAMTVQVSDGGLDLSVGLGAGGLDTVDLDNNDSLVASAAGKTTTLDGGTFLGVAGYGGRIDGVSAPGTRVRIALARGAGDTSAPNSVVTLPQPIRIAAPRPGRTVSRAKDLLIRVNRAPGDIRVTWKGSCIDSTVGRSDFANGDPVVIPANTITRASTGTGGGRVAQRCLMTLTVSRVSVGRVDDAYDGGRIVALRSTSIAVRTVR